MQNLPPIERLSIRDAEALARELFGVSSRADELPGEYDDNFRLRADGGREFVLKVMHPEREQRLVDMQVGAIRHLEAANSSLSLPRIIPLADGSLYGRAPGAAAENRLVWMLNYIHGQTLASVRPHCDALLEELGKFLGRLDGALLDFDHAGARRQLKWDLARAAWIGEHLERLPDDGRPLVERFLKLYDDAVSGRAPKLRESVIHNDANDHNVIVRVGRSTSPKMAGLIDFGDAVRTWTICELAVAAAYVMLGKPDPLRAAARVVAGYHAAYPLEDVEVEVLFALICARLSVSVTNSAISKLEKPDDAYVTVTEAPAWETLRRLAGVPPGLAHAVFREACGWEPAPGNERVVRWLKHAADDVGPILDVDLRRCRTCAFDLGVGSTFLGADPAALRTEVFADALQEKMAKENAEVGLGRYNEARLCYTEPMFGERDSPVAERRTIHLGVDLFVEVGTAVRAPLDGKVHTVTNNTAPQDYGPLVILRHETGGGHEFFTLYGHLSEASLGALVPGQPVEKGQEIGQVGTVIENGGWPPHLHFQIIVDLLGLDHDFPGVARASQRRVWLSLSPDPNLLLGIPPAGWPSAEPSGDETLAARRRFLGGNLSIAYERPLKIVRGWKQYLYNDTGRAFLDVFNNVPLVGHSHPRVVAAACEQLALLNTNTRYLHDNIVRYAERLTQKMPRPLQVCFFVNSGSEANELALRLARSSTGRRDVIVLEAAYHGNTTTLVDISPYKFDGPGGGGRKRWVHTVPIADDFRGPYRRGEPQVGRKYARHVADAIAQIDAAGSGLSAYIAETLPSVGGQIVFPNGYLAAVYEHVRAAGGVCIADEVQVGFGRLGSHYWGFETQAVVPDIVVLGKPMGNGFPLSAVVTTKEIAGAFDNGMEYFSTFGGNPVSCAVGLAVMDVVEEDGLQANALEVGRYLKERLKALEERHALVGDVRGLGLFLGVELIRDPGTLEPATAEAAYVVNRLCERGVLAGTDGPHDNVIKIRPPLIFSAQDADLFAEVLGDILKESALGRCRP